MGAVLLEVRAADAFGACNLELRIVINYVRRKERCRGWPITVI